MEQNQKKFIWIKLSNENLFNDIRIKKLRNIAGGDVYTIICLKLMLMAKRNNEIIEYEGLEKTIEDELSLKIDEEPENILITINYLKSVDMLDVKDNLNELNKV